jgi:small-conductance mechanosensitive channel
MSRVLIAMVVLAQTAAWAEEPSPSASPVELAGPQLKKAPVTVRGKTVFSLAAYGDRPRAASRMLAAIVEEHGPPPPVTLEPLDDGGQLVRVGEKELIKLGLEDAAAVGLEPVVYYQSVRTELERFFAREHSRARLQEGVLAVSMAVFLGLLTLLGIRWLGRRSDDLRAWIEEKARISKGLRVRELEVLSPQALESVLLALLGIGSFLVRVGLVYSYLVYALSRFDVTKQWVPHISRAVASPFGALFERLGAALPAAILLVVGAYLVRGGLRIVRVFLDHVSRGELRPSWLPADMAAPTRPLAAVLLVLIALVTLGPVVSGVTDGVLSRIGLLGLLTVALGGVPAVASILLGTAIIYSRRYELGHWVQIGDHVGEVTSVGFLDVSLVPLGAGRIRVPHLLTLFVTVRHLAGPPAVEVDVPVSPSAAPYEVVKIIEDALAPMGQAKVSLTSIAVGAAWYRASLPGAHPDAHGEALARASAALNAAQIPLGK